MFFKVQRTYHPSVKPSLAPKGQSITSPMDIHGCCGLVQSSLSLLSLEVDIMTLLFTALGIEHAG